MRILMLVNPTVYEATSADFVPSADLVAKMAKCNIEVRQVQEMSDFSPDVQKTAGR